MRLSYLLIFLIFSGTALSAQDTYKRMPYADVLHYNWAITLTDDSNSMQGEAKITVAFNALDSSIYFDLVGNSGEYGMTVESVRANGEDVSIFHVDNKLMVPVSADTMRYEIIYSGVAERGLVIDKTKYGNRSFFGDNWPNLGRHWLPGIDHPYDKASVEFEIIAPATYDVIATGVKIEESYLENGMKYTHYVEPSPVAMKVVTIGVTKFASKLLGHVDDVPVSAWVYPENREDGFYDYAMAIPVMEYFIENIGPYPFAKLGNMQAKTQWGGLENAGTIAYNENSVDGKRSSTGLIAHEIAHQWFGNSASEADWNHVWLSEGFATYFAILFMEHYKGTEVRQAESALDRKQVIDFYKRNPSPIVDPSIKDPMKVLNTNSYQKGGWVLHMLRVRMGDEQFWKAIRIYYDRYTHSNALTEDLQDVFEEVSGESLDEYFQQWVYRPGFPELDVESKIKGNNVELKIEQQQDEAFSFPLEIGMKHADGSVSIKTIDIVNKKESFSLTSDNEITEILIDPNVNLLFENKTE